MPKSKSARKRSSASMVLSWWITIWCSTYARKSKRWCNGKKATSGSPFCILGSLRRLALCRAHHLAGMGQGFAGEIDAAKHAGDFLNAVAVLQVGYGGAGGIAAAGFVHEQVVMALVGHLRQVGDGQDLAAFTQSAQELANHFGGGAADANVDFVEYQGRHPRGLRGDDLNRQADA